MVKLGAKESFNDVEPENIYEILKSISCKDESQEGKLSQTIYKLALESLVQNKSTIPIPSSLTYFSFKEGVGSYRPKVEVYYSDNSVLPKKIVEKLVILNYTDFWSRSKYLVVAAD